MQFICVLLWILSETAQWNILAFKLDAYHIIPSRGKWPEMSWVKLFYTSVNILYLQSWGRGDINVTSIIGVAIVCLSFSAIYSRSFCHPSNILMGRMVLPSLTPRIWLASTQQHSQTTPPLPAIVPDSRPSRLNMREFESTSPLITLRSTTSPSDWKISGDLSWRPNPVPLDLTGSTTTCWNTSQRTR